MDDDQLLLTVGETARLLRLSRAFTYDLAARGDLPVVRFGRRILVPRDALESHLRKKADNDDSVLASQSARIPEPLGHRRTSHGPSGRIV